jgi:hypothetical protein
MGKTKSTSTPEEWSAHLEYHRLRRLENVERERERLREYNARPEVKERRRLHDAKHSITEKRREYAKTQEAKQRAIELREMKKADPERWAAHLAAQRARRTGVTAAAFKALLQFQQNKCAVCHRSFEGRQIRADHCHDTSAPRGLLCHHCNIIEGMLRSMQISPSDFAHRLNRYLNCPPVLELTR